jgi:Ser/Thr protein kinase RdoA (MazF antagonist)
MDRAAAEAAYTPAAWDALGAFAIAPVEAKLVSLAENVTFRVTGRDGAGYVLRLHRPGYHTLDELDSERVWIAALSAAGIAVPRAVPARGGRDYVAVAIASTNERRYAGLSHWTNGELLADVLRQSKGVGDVEGYYAQLGTIAASMHNQASAWRVPAEFKRHAFDADGLMGEAPFWGRFWEHPALSSAERALVLRTRDRIRAALERYGRDGATFSMIHADLHTGNLLLDGDRLTVIDFDDAGFGWHQYDVAVALFGSMTSVDYPVLERAFVGGYRTTREISDAALELLPMFLLIRGLAIIGWIHQRPELDRSQYMRSLKDQLCAQCDALEPPC